MGSSIDPTVGGGVLKPKNANCEGGTKHVIHIFCTHIVDLHETQYPTGTNRMRKGGKSRP